ncbi:MAG: hypothetical protein MJ091_06935 [Clostridia bacterium]|nr:hypothetical protein [Clostridia bacterium]
MARFELNTYGANDEVLKHFETDKVRWGVFMQAIEVEESLGKKSAAEQFELINAFMKKIFPDLTDADLENADYDDVMNTFKQLMHSANAIKGTNGGTGAGEVKN